MLSIIIPFLNEEKNLTILHGELKKVLDREHLDHEIIFVNDGSSDGSGKEIGEIAEKDKSVVVLTHKKPFGKGRAILTGLARTKGDTVVFMDADLQDDPGDLPKFVAKLEGGAELVNGIRTNRQDNAVVKLYSSTVNFLLQKVLHSPFDDINCGFKAFRRYVVDDIDLYGNNFRFLPLAAFYRGFDVDQVPVHNRTREYGKSKYGIKKLFIGIIDTLTAYFIYQFSEQPLHFFGIIGGLFFLAGFAISLVLAVERIFFNMLLYRRPALLFGILLIIVGIQIAMTGIIGELIVYQHKKSRRVRSQS